MKHLLARDNRAALGRLAASNALIAFDYDGTLAPIVKDPDRARLRPRTRRLLAQVAERYPCAVISGRARDDAMGRLGDLPIRGVIGNHGLEPSAELGRYAAEVKRWLPVIAASLADLPGVVVEDKTYSLAIHYRRSREKRRALAAIHAATATLGPVRLVGGKEVVNVLVEGAPHKGAALDSLRSQLGCEAALYVGDDDTDEDAFALSSERMLAVRIGRRDDSRAPYYLRDQKELDDLLDELLALRPRPASGAGGAPSPLGEVLEFMRVIWALDHGLQTTSKRMENALGVTGPQRLVIRIVGRLPGISAGRLAGILHLHPSTLTGVLQRLERRGLLVRRADPLDARRACFGLTERGRRLDVRSGGTVEDAVERALRELPADKLAAAREVLEALARTLS